MDDTKPSLEDWLEHVFDHPVTATAWHWDPDAPELLVDPSHTAHLILETFERSSTLLAAYTDAQVNQGLYYLVSGSCSDYMVDAMDRETVDTMLRVRVLQSFVPLFETTMAHRCSPHLSHFDGSGRGALNLTCYMWWDEMGYTGTPNVPSERAVDMAALASMERILAIPHDACRESALHGLGHLHFYYPDEVATVIDRWLSTTSGLHNRLRSYAESARIGMVQ